MSGIYRTDIYFFSLWMTLIVFVNEGLRNFWFLWRSQSLRLMGLGWTEAGLVARKLCGGHFLEMAEGFVL